MSGDDRIPDRKEPCRGVSGGGIIVRTEKNGNRVIVYPEGRIDASNAPDLQKELEAVRAENGGCELEVDAGGLEYISSGGLRALLQLTKTQDRPLAVVNVAPAVYEILEMTGFTKLLRVKKAYRSLDVDGCEVIGRGFYGTIYRIDDETIVKVYRGKDSIPMIENEIAMAKTAFLGGIPTAIAYDIVRVGEDYGSVFEMLRASTYMEWIRNSPEDRELITDSYARFLRQVNSTVLDSGTIPSAKRRFLDCLEGVKGVLPADQYGRLEQLIEAVPESMNAVHGDCHLKNVMRVNGEPMLIDMDTLSVGNAVFELACIFFGIMTFEEDEPGNTMRFYGISHETAEYVWNRTTQIYFGDRDADTLPDLRNRAVLLGWLYFLYRMQTDFKGKPLSDIRTVHACGHIKELLGIVRELAV